MLQRAERTIQLNLQVNLDGARKALAKLRAELKDKPLKVEMEPNTGTKWKEGLQRLKRDLRDLDTDVSVFADPDTTYARARIGWLTRPRTVMIFARLARSSMTTVATQIAALSGARLASDYLRRLRDSLENLDRSLPRIAGVSLAITNLASAAIAASGGIIALGSDLASIGGAALALPGILGGAAAGITTMALALADMGEQLEHLGPLFTQLQDEVSSNFWAVAKAPIEDMVRNVLPAFRTEMAETSTNIGEFFATLSQAVQAHVTADALAPMFDNLRSSIDIAAGALDPLIDAVMTLGQVGSEYLPRLAQWFVDISNSFNDWVQRNTESGQMFVWIDEGIAALQDLGSVLASTVRIFSGINKAAEAAGSQGLAGFAQWMREIADIVNGPRFQEGLTTIFEGAGAAMSALGDAMGDVGDALYNMRDTISTVLETAGQTVGTLISDIATAVQHPAFQTGLVSFFEGIQAGLAAVGPALPALAAAFGQVGEFAGQLATTLGQVLGVAIQTVAPIIGQLLAALQPLIPILGDALIQIIGALSPLLMALPPIMQALVAALTPVIEAIGPIVQALLPALLPLLTMVADVITMLSPLIAMIAQTFTEVAVALAPLIAQLIEGLVPVVMQLVEALLPILVDLWTQIAAVLPTLIPLFGMIVESVLGLVEAFAPLIIQLIDMLAPILSDLISSVLPGAAAALLAVIPPVLQLVENIAGFLIPIIESLLPVVQTVFETVSGIIQGAMSVIQGVINVVMGVIQGDWSQAWEGIKQIASGVWQIISSVVSGAINAVLGIISSVLGVISSLWSAGWSAIGNLLSSAWDGIVNAVRSGVDNVVSFFQELPGRIRSFLASLPGRLKTMGRDMITGLANGIRNAGQAVMNAIGGVVDGAINWAKSKLGIASPSKVFRQFGEWTGEGFADGIKRQTRNVRSAADVMVRQTSDAFDRRNRLAEAANRDLERMQPRMDATSLISSQDPGSSSVATLERGAQPATTMVVQGPLVSVESLTVDSDDRVKQLSQDLYRRAADAGRANGKINLGGAVS
jgi:phage-related protein